jgi:hypothetical protein
MEVCGHCCTLVALLSGKEPNSWSGSFKGKNLSSFLGIKTADGPAHSLVTVSTALLWLQKHVGYIKKICTNDVYVIE